MTQIRGRFRVDLRCMSASEIADMIPASTIAEIKKTDPRPLFKSFRIAHEGRATGYLVGVGNVVKYWYRDVIQKLYEKIKLDLSAFHSHTDEANTNRPVVGRVVGKKMATIGGLLSDIVAIYIEPSHRRHNFDVASIEANVDMDIDAEGKIVVRDVNELSGIALASSQVEQPGFEGATVLGELRAFAKKNYQQEGNTMPMSADEIKQAIREAGFTITDIFHIRDIMADPVVEERITEKSPSNAEFARMRRELSDAEKKLGALEKENGSLKEKAKNQETELATSKYEIAKARVSTLFDKQKTDRSLDERQVEFIRARLPQFTLKDPKELESEFNKYLDSEIDEYGKIAKIMGVETKPTNGKETPGEKGTGTEPNEAERKSQSENPMLDPAKNDFIKIGSDD